MAEFVEVMKQCSRMCKAHPAPRGCSECSIGSAKNGTEFGCGSFVRKEPAKAEKLIMQWVAEHPEPRYPTWKEWWASNFQTASGHVFPCHFMPESEWYSVSKLPCKACDECRNAPIPAEIAAKLGIKPIGGAEDG